jgi:hypothetical protein
VRLDHISSHLQQLERSVMQSFRGEDPIRADRGEHALQQVDDFIGELRDVVLEQRIEVDDSSEVRLQQLVFVFIGEGEPSAEPG